MVVAQPTSSKGQPVTQYTNERGKTTKEHVAELNVRVISLFDSKCLDLGLELSSISKATNKFRSFFLHYSPFLNVEVIVYLCDSSANNPGEEQTSIEWHSREIISSNGHLSSFLYFELNFITLKQIDLTRKYPLYNSQLCRCRFNFTWAVRREPWKKRQFDVFALNVGSSSKSIIESDYCIRAIRHCFTSFSFSKLDI